MLLCLNSPDKYSVFDMTSMAKSYLAATKNLKTDYTHGTGYMQDGGSYQKISVSERQRISNLIRKALGLKTKTVSTDSIDTSTSSSSSLSSTTTDSDTTGRAGNTVGPSDNGAAASNGADSGTTGGYSAGNDQKNNSTGY